MKHTVEVMISEQEVHQRIAELGRQISEDYRDSGSEMVLVGLDVYKRQEQHNGQTQHPTVY